MTRTAVSLGFGLLILSAAASQKPETAPMPRASGKLLSVPHKVVRVSPEDAKHPGEVSVAINPVYPEHIVVSSFQSPQPGRYFTNNHTYSSTDDGDTWKHLAAPNPDRRNQGDDSVTFGHDGTVYHCYLSALGYFGQNPPRACSGLFVRRSLDGVKWASPVPVVDHINTAEPLEDKPWIVVDTVNTSPHRGNVYVSWTRFDKYGSRDPEHKSRIFLSRSRDGGKTFTTPVRLSDKSGNALDDSGTVEGAVPCVGPKGEVYVAWAGPEGIVMDKSEDGGFTFGKDVKVADHTGWSFDVPGIGRNNGLPVTGCDTSRGKNRGSVYVCWIDKRNGDPDVFVSASRDGAKTWGEPVRVNNDGLKNGKDQLFAWLAVDPADGSVNVVFNDRRDNADAKDTRLAVTVARSVDGGRSFGNYAVRLEPFPIGNAFLGDYNGIAARGGKVVAVFPHFIRRDELAVSAAIFRFRPGTLDVVGE
jgi:hypothetical protein